MKSNLSPEDQKRFLALVKGEETPDGGFSSDKFSIEHRVATGSEYPFAPYCTSATDYSGRWPEMIFEISKEIQDLARNLGFKIRVAPHEVRYVPKVPSSITMKEILPAPNYQLDTTKPESENSVQNKWKELYTQFFQLSEWKRGRIMKDIDNLRISFDRTSISIEDDKNNLLFSVIKDGSIIVQARLGYEIARIRISEIEKCPHPNHPVSFRRSDPYVENSMTARVHESYETMHGGRRESILERKARNVLGSLTEDTRKEAEKTLRTPSHAIVPERAHIKYTAGYILSALQNAQRALEEEIRKKQELIPRNTSTPL